MPEPAFGTAFTALLRAAGLTPDAVRTRLGERRSMVSRTTLYDWMKGEHLPEDDGPLMEVVTVCLAAARERGAPLAPAPEHTHGWRRLLADAKQARDAHAATSARASRQGPRPGGPGLTIRRWNPVALGVHRAIGGGPLPGYVRRRHDDLLRALLDPAVMDSRTVLLRGGSSTGKTRAAYEAVQECLPDWRLDYPRTASILARRIQDGLPPLTVLWLDDLWQFTGPDSGVLAELSDALTTSSRVVVIATLWPAQWAAYLRDTGPVAGSDADRPVTARADSLRGLKPLLVTLPEIAHAATDIDPAFGGIIDVPDRFTSAELTRAGQLGDRAVIGAVAAAEAAGSPGMVTQYLAGVPDLEAHYRGPGADPYGIAVISAAIDMARFGHAGPYSEELLHQAVVGYLDDPLRTVEQQRWWRNAMEYATRELNGAVAALTPLPPLDGTGVDGYRLADYLDQLGRRIRMESRGPATLWESFAAHASRSADLSRLAQSAYDRGLYRFAAILWRKAILAGGISAVQDLLDLLRAVDRRSVRPAARWAAAHLPIDSPAATARAIRILRKAGQRKAASMLAARAAALVTLDNGDDLADFLGVLAAMGEGSAIHEIVMRLTRSAAGSVGTSATLLRNLNAAGHHDAAVLLAMGLAREGDLSAPSSVWLVLDTARECGDQEARVRQVLLDRRPARSVAVHDGWAVAMLLQTLRRVGATQAVTDLAERAAEQVALASPATVTRLLEAFRDAGEHAAVATLLARDPAEHVSLRHAGRVSELFCLLRELGRPERAAALGRRFATAARLSEPRGLHALFRELTRAGEHESASILARRAVAQRVLRPLAVDLTYTWEAVWLIGELYVAGEEQAALALAAQLVEEEGPVRPWRHGGVDDLLATARRMVYDYGPAVARAITAPLTGHQYVQGPLDNPGRIANNLKWLDRAFATDAIEVLLRRRPQDSVLLTDPYGIARLLGTLRRLTGPESVARLASESISGLLARQPETSADIADTRSAVSLLDELRKAGAAEAFAVLAQRMASEAPIADADSAARLLIVLAKARIGDGVAELASRAAQQASLGSPAGAANLIKVLAVLRMPDEAASVAMRSARQTALGVTQDVADLIDAMQQAGTIDALAVLADRAADAGHFEQLANRGLAADFTYGREPDGTASLPWGWRDLAD